MSIQHADPPPRIVREPNTTSYLTSERLGKGGFAICHRAEVCHGSQSTGHIVALKIVRSKMEPQKLAQKFVTELQLHSKLKHPNIVEFYKAFSFESSTYVVLEICDNGSLGDIIKKRKYLTMPEIRRYLIQICGAVKYLHYRNIVHRDLKTGNIFLDANMNVKVGDFGLAAVLVGKNDIGLRRTTMCGTPNYLAPEILEKTGRGHNEKVDIWAVGVIAYTLAVGKAPFHAAKKEGIFKNLQSRSYEWPDLATHSNDISNDLQYLVSSLLVDEDDRPTPDTIVSHPFFRMAFIPDQLPSTCTSTEPSWPQARLPSSDTIQRGYSESWFNLCKECGVGELGEKTFPIVGLTSASIVRDIEREIKAGKAPTVPLSCETVYLPFISKHKDKNINAKSNLSQINEESSSAASSHIAEVTKPSKPAKDFSVSESKENLPPKSRQVERMQTQRPPKMDTALRRARSNRMKAEDMIRTESATQSIKNLQISARSYNPTASITTNTETMDPNLPKQIPTLQRRPISKSMTTLRDRPIQVACDPVQPDSLPTPESLENENYISRPAKAPPVRPMPRSRTISRDETNVPKTLHQRTVSKAIPVATVQEIKEIKEIKVRNSNTDGSLANTDPIAVLEMANQLRQNLLSSISSRSITGRNKEKSPTLPLVTKWVDYAKRHGIGYVLSNGTVGCIFTPSDDLPIRNVIVRDGSDHLAQINTDKGFVLSDLPVEFYSLGGTENIKPLTIDPKLQKTNTLLWSKFAKYMCSSLVGMEIAKYDQEDYLMVRYYQRLGCVGVFGFSNGCFQFNFPDHTKLVVSGDGKHCRFNCLPLEAITELKETGQLPIKYVRARVMLAGPIPSLLHGVEDRALTKANCLKQKLQYVNSIVGLWIDGKGLGCKPEAVNWPKWNGLQIEDKASMSQDWIIVGKLGKSVVVETAPAN